MLLKCADVARLFVKAITKRTAKIVGVPSGGSEMIKHSELVDWFTRELRRDKEWTYGLRYDPMIKVRRFGWQIHWLEDLAPYNLRQYRAHLKKFSQV